ncbi:MAG TPA: hypothetical protein VGA18_05535, partial [Rhodothermales bacterium]
KAAEEKREKQSADRARKRTPDKEQREYSSYQRQSAGGAATLGELSGLEDLRRQMEEAEGEAEAGATEGGATEVEAAEPKPKKPRAKKAKASEVEGSADADADAEAEAEPDASEEE